MAIEPTCCDCDAYEARPANPETTHEGYCQVQHVRVHWNDVPCRRYRGPQAQRTVHRPLARIKLLSVPEVRTLLEQGYRDAEDVALQLRRVWY